MDGSISIEDAIQLMNKQSYYYSGNIDPVKANKENYKKIKNEWDTYYKLTQTVEKKLYKLCLNYNRDSKIDEVLDLEGMNKFLHLGLLSQWDFKEKDDQNQALIYLFMTVWGAVMYAPLTNYEFMSYPVILDNKFICFILFDSDKISDIFTITIENTYDISGEMRLKQLKWKNCIHKTEFNKNK